MHSAKLSRNIFWSCADSGGGRSALAGVVRESSATRPHPNATGFFNCFLIRRSWPAYHPKWGLSSCPRISFHLVGQPQRLMRHESPATVLVNPHVDEAKMSGIDGPPFLRSFDPRDCGYDSPIAVGVKPRFKRFIVDLMIFTRTGEVVDIYLLGVRLSVGVRVGQVVGKQILERSSITLDRSIGPRPVGALDRLDRLGVCCQQSAARQQAK